MAKTKKTPPSPVKGELIAALQTRFEKNKARHKDVKWEDVLRRLEKAPAKLQTLQAMEETGGEPDVVGFDAESGEYLFYDCAPETPTGRRSVCYDREGWESRKEHRPDHSAMEMAEEMGIELLNEEEYRYLQTLGTFDAKTSSWLKTPEKIRKLGGAIFGDHRYATVFVYHNGAQSYYAARGFRGSLRV